MLIKIRTISIESLEKLRHPDTFFKEAEATERFHSACEFDMYYDYFEQYWDSSFENRLKAIIYACGPHYFNFLFDSFYGDYVPYINSFLQLHNSKDHFSYETDNHKVYYALNDYLTWKAENLISNRQVPLLIRHRICHLSGAEFSDNNFGASTSYYFRRIPELELLNYWLDIAPYNLKAFRRIGGETDVRASIKDFGHLLYELGFTVPKNSTELSILKNVKRTHFLRIIPLMQRCYYPFRYAKVFGDYLTALFESGHLGDKPILKTNIGYRVKANDGHICYSLAEKVIDDWLYRNGIIHDKEPLYPKEMRILAGANFKADWKIGNVYIEYFGLQNKPEYAKKSDAKLRACSELGINLIPLYPGDEHHLDNILEACLALFKPI